MVLKSTSSHILSRSSQILVTTFPSTPCLHIGSLILGFRDVGFLRYWTTSQLPNFLIASPHLLPSFAALHTHLITRQSYTSLLSDPLTPHILALAAMATLLLTSMHVQIATRILTSFPALYWYVAAQVVDDFRGVWVERTRFWHGVVKGMVTFAGVGAVLYAAFLPPA